MTDYEKIYENWAGHFEWRYVVDNYAPCSVLDFGCGYGFSDLYLARAGFEAFGYDPNSERIAVANDIRSRRPVDIRERTSFSVEFPYIGSYGLIWSSHVFEHISYGQWGYIFSKLPICDKILISVPLGYAYDMPEHIHHWENGDVLREKLEEFSGLRWSTSVDETNRVIRAKLEAQ